MNSLQWYKVVLKLKKVRILDTGQRNETVATVLVNNKKERQRQYNREYYRRPYVISRRRTPEKLAEKAEYDTQYQNRPGVREHYTELQRIRRARKKETISKC